MGRRAASCQKRLEGTLETAVETQIRTDLCNQARKTACAVDCQRSYVGAHNREGVKTDCWQRLPKGPVSG